MCNVYATSDWHGCGDVAKKVFDFLQPDDILYFLGDANDRGPDGYALIKQLLNDKRVVYIKGNHEDFFERYTKELKDETNFSGEFYWLGRNGGEETYEAAIKDFELDKIIKKVKDLPLKKIYYSHKGHTVIMDHSGYTPGNMRYHHDPLWDRDHFDESWSKDEMFKNVYIVHGHTPVQYLKFMFGYNGQPKERSQEEIEAKNDFLADRPTTWKPTILRYCNEHKFCTDMCTIASGRIALLNLDTFEEIYFDKDEE